MLVGSLFSGIGGMDLGLERAGMQVIWQSEIDPYASRVLAKHWPEVPNYGDITKIDWSTIRKPDIVCGGYPCQPFSTAGKRQGTLDPRHLWPYFKNAISALQPRYALLENVRGHLTMGGTGVIADLAALGYDAEWRVISAAGMGAPHLRHRLIIVAYPTRSNARITEPYGVGKVFNQTTEFRKQNCTNGTISDWSKNKPGMDRVANGIPDRMDRLKGLGNAVVPQVAEYVGHLIMGHAHN